jgi:hypothetical protein
MLSIFCALLFDDGQEATGMVEAITSGVKYPFAYSGASDRLPMKYSSGTPTDLELIFNVAASRTGGKLTITRVGEYQPRAEVILSV